MNWKITKRKKHNLDEDIFVVEFNESHIIKFDVADARHFIEQFDDAVNSFGK